MKFSSDRFLVSRRAILAAAATSGLGRTARAAEDSTPLKVGILPFGAVQWEIETLKSQGLDKAEGIRVETVTLASPEAARLAFLSGSVDTVVQDLLFAARLKAENRSVVFLPQSSTEGELVVPAETSIAGLADLKSKKIGVAGGSLDKNWLFLRAAALQQAKLDLTKEATIVFGAPPLLAAKMESGELDCVLIYWSQAARLKAKGFRSISSTEDVLKDLGARGQVAVGGYLFRAETKHETLRSFRRAVRASERLLSDRPDAWNPIRPMMKAPDNATFEALKKAYLRGIPRKGRAEEIADARAFITIIKRLGGSALLGPVTELPEDLYVDSDIYG